MNVQPTSLAAGRQARTPEKVRPAYARLLAALEAHGPLTDRELQAICRMSGDTERPRRQELQRQGKVRDSGRKRVLPDSDREAILWELVPAEVEVRTDPRGQVLLGLEEAA